LALVGVMSCDGQSKPPARDAKTPSEVEAKDPAPPLAVGQPKSGPEPTGRAKPTPEIKPKPAPPADFGHADLDPGNDQVLGPPEPLADCESRLADAGVVWKKGKIKLKDKREGVYTCGSHQAVWVKGGRAGIRYSSSPLLSCPMAIALADFEQIVQEEAQRHFGVNVERIDFMSTYACRKMARFDMISEHSFANAIDIRRFRLEGKKTVDVLDDFHPEQDDTKDPKALFLRIVANRLYDENVFSTVLTPYFDRLHRNHFHLDLARYRVDGSRP